MSDLSTRRFIKEALLLLSSYFYSEQVVLLPLEVEAGEEPSDEYERFSQILRMRHAVACGLRLKPIVESIERGVSAVSEVVRAESKGAIKGRLDAQLYLNRRSTVLSWPRSFPVLVARESPNTPENQLVADTLRQLMVRLDQASVPEGTAERSYCLSLLRWSRERMHSEPWSRVATVRASERLKRETVHRAIKRQTGNEPAYSEFLAWYRQWQFDAAEGDSEQVDRLINLLLAFPPGDFFEDRVFEIWCLQQVMDSFLRCGAVVESGPHPLSQRAIGAICEMRYDDYRVGIWFQHSLPRSAARWQYIHSGSGLAGTPDITVLGNDGRMLLIDAKRRLVATKTRSEETYKMLGYLENFSQLFQGFPYCAALCFLSASDLFTELESGGNRVFLMGAHPDDPEVCALGGRMDTVVSEWLSLVTD